MNPNELRAQADELIKEAEVTQKLAKKAERDLTDEENTLIDENIAKAEELQEKAASIEAREQEAAERTKRIEAASKKNRASSRQAEDDDDEFTRDDVKVGRDRVESDPKLNFKTFGDYAASVMNAGTPGQAYDKRLDYCSSATGLNQTSPSGGGFVVPTEFSNQIMEGVMGEPDSLLSMTDSYTVEGEAIEFPAIHETSRADGSRQGGVRGYWLSEAEQITSSSQKFRRVRLEPQEIGVLIYATNKLMRNSPQALEQLIVRGASQEINFMVGDAIINGDGVGKPKGILSSPCLVTISEESGQAADSIVTENIDNMWARLPARSRARAVWFINQDCEPQIQQLSADVGTGGVPLYRRDIQVDGFGTLYGRPVIPLEYCQTVGDAGDIILADMSMYATGTQGGVEQAMSMHLRFDYAETAFRTMFAVDGQTWLSSAITPKNGSNSISPFVVIEARTG